MRSSSLPAARTTSTRSATRSSSSDGRSSSRDGLDEAGDDVRSQPDASFEQLSSESHRAAAWIAQGDLAAARGDDRAPRTAYRRAAEALAGLPVLAERRWTHDPGRMLIMLVTLALLVAAIGAGFSDGR